MGVDLTGALVGVDGASRVTLQNSSNVSCVQSLAGLASTFFHQHWLSGVRC